MATPPAVSIDEGQRRHIEQEHVFDVALEHAALNAGADRDDFIRVHTFVRLFADEGARSVDHFRHAGHAADEHELVDVFLGQLRVSQAILDRLDRALEQIVGELFELRARQFLLNVFRSARIRRDERQIDFVFLRAGERDLRFFSFFFNALDRIRLLGQIDAHVFLKFGDDPVHQLRVPIVAAEVGVAVGRFDFKNAVADFEHGNVERAAAQIVNRDLLVLLLVQTVGERCRRRLIDNSQHFETGDLARVFGRVALRVVEISRNGDDRLRDFFAELRFRVGFHLRQNHRGNFRRRERLLLSRSLPLARARRRSPPSRSCKERDALPHGPRRTSGP